MDRNSPRIAVSAQRCASDGCGAAIDAEYMEMLSGFGAAVMPLSTETDDAGLLGALEYADGLLLLPRDGGVREENESRREHAEGVLLDRAMSVKMPCLGIGGGMRAMSVNAGGELAGGRGDRGEDGARSRQDVVLGTLLSAIAMSNTIVVFDCVDGHDEPLGADSLGENVKAQAFDERGDVSSIYRTDMPFCMGVGWHPEREDSRRRNVIAEAFVGACREYHMHRKYCSVPYGRYAA